MYLDFLPNNVTNTLVLLQYDGQISRSIILLFGEGEHFAEGNLPIIIMILHTVLVALVWVIPFKVLLLFIVTCIRMILFTATYH